MAGISLERQDGVATLLIDNGQANSLTSAMLSSLSELLEVLGTDEETGAIVIAGAGGRSFCAGSDIGELKALHESGEGPMALLDLENAAFDRLAGMEKPTIAAVEGAASGGGAELAICCDLIVAGDKARFSLPEIKLGVYPGAGGTIRLPRRIGHARALELMLLGDEIDAQTALNWGLANRLSEAGRALEDAQKIGRRLARGPREAQRRLKAAIHANFTMRPDEVKPLVRRHSEELGAGPDIAEGMRAFFARERAVFNRKG